MPVPQRENIISPQQAQTLSGLFYERIQKTPDNIAYVQFNRKTENWEQTSWDEMGQMIAHWQDAIKQEQLESGDRVAIWLKNSREWVALDQAAIGLGLVVVPLYMDDRPDNIAYILKDADVKLLVIQEQRQWNRLKDAFNQNDDQVDSLKTIVLLDVNQANLELDDKRLVTLSDWLPEKQHLLLKQPMDPQALATIVYTSGTTGKPKGVMLSHYNILSVAYATAQQVDIQESDSLLSFLPLSHTLERTVGYYLAVMSGCKVYFSQSVQHLASELVLHQPTFLICVPRIFEQIYIKITEQLKKAPLGKRLLFKLTVYVGWQVFLTKQKYSKVNVCPLCLLWPLLKKLVADKVMEKFGGHLRIAASGGAAIQFPVAKTFLSLGLNLLQGYGLTETSPVVSFNRLDNNDPKSIGETIEGVQVKLGERQELLIKSPGVMLGYWNNHSATAEVIDADGWFHSGDQASINEQTGHIYITGRIKDILVMSNGEKIPPGDIENTITVDSWFDQALLVGEGEAFLSAILVMNSNAWVDLAKQHGLDPFDKANLKHKKLQKQVIRHLQQVLHDFPGYAKIRRVILTLEPWTIDNELMTPTMKIKRAKVLQLYQAEISAIYD